MRNMFAGFLLVGLGLAVSPAHAAGLRGRCRDCPPPACPQFEIKYVDKVVTCYKPVWKDVEVKVHIPKITCKEVMEKVKVTVCVPRWEDQKITMRYCRPICRETVADVRRCVSEPVAVIHPCTGCPCVTYQLKWITEKVKVCVPDFQWESKEAIIKVCRIDRHDKIVDQKRIIRECSWETKTCMRRVCHQEPYQTTVRVPVCVPCGTTMPPGKE